MRTFQWKKRIEIHRILIRTLWLLAILLVVAVSFALLRSVVKAGYSALPYMITDSEQSNCYDGGSVSGSGTKITCPAAGESLYGQDAQFSGNSPSYTLSINGLTVYDNYTQLTWESSPDTSGDGQLTPDDKLTYTKALAHCAAHSAAGYEGFNDWRLPSIKELYSLIQFNGTDPSGWKGTDTSSLTPFINTGYFQFAYGQISAGERIIDSQYASSTLYAPAANQNASASSGSLKLFGVNFADGRIKGYDLTMPGGAEKTFFVQCVRGNPAYGVNDFEDNGDLTITDHATGLMWSQADSGAALNWQESLAWVQEKNSQNYLGHNDWRLPNAKELQSIVDYTRSPDTTNSAAIDPIFNATSITNEASLLDWPWYWTSTNHVTYDQRGAAAVYIAFGRAGGWQKANPTDTCYSFVDVHGAGAQRSDPKITGDLVPMDLLACSGQTAYGRGPQGDVLRAANYVRLVRDAESTSNIPAGSIRLYIPLVAQVVENPSGPTSTPTQAATITPTPTQTPTLTPTVSPTKVPAFNIDQTLSDGAQRNTIAFDGLAFLTGTLGADSFFPPGKVADFWGFQYLRDNDPTEMGHNTDFLTRAALNMLYILTPAQRAELITLAEGQVADINQYGYDRFVLMQAFRRLLDNDLPAGATGLSLEAVKAYSAQLYRLDGQISYERAQVMGKILVELDADQRAYLDAMVGNGMLTWPVVSEPDDLRSLSHDVKVAVMTYAGDLFSWYAGSTEADVYFCPERQGTYFGSFYMKDAPAVGNPGYTIPSNLTADMGDAFLRTLSTDQAALVTNLVTEQKTGLYEIVDRRQDVSILLRQFMDGTTPDQAAVLAQMERYGELDGEIVYRYATAFAAINTTLTADQRAALIKMRTDLLVDLSYPAGAYLYAEAIPMPNIPNTDFLFSGPSTP